MKKIQVLFCFLIISAFIYGKEYHVSVKGNNSNSGTEIAPFKTIQRASQVAYPGDVITVHAGTYREWVNPLRGGTGDDCRIVYRAAPGERVEIKGSEQITSWQKQENGAWKVTLPATFFGDYNPYIDLVHGDWFDDYKRIHHTGEVFLNNKSLYEKETLEKVLHPVENPDAQDKEGSIYTWYCESENGQTTIWANFHNCNPNKELVEISARKTCFYPEKQGINYLTIQGFHISQAATQWGAPTAEQIGMVATHWNKGWIIENNVISNSKCSGITLGKERGTGHNTWLNNPGMDGSLHYIEVIFKTLRNGWNKEQIGSHIVRNNEIFACEQTGICGSMGAAFSVIEHNHIHHIWTKRQFAGAEIAGIKFHAAIDTQIKNNRIHNVCMGMWMDWMTQGTRISRNLIYDNDHEDLFFEVNHGPYLVDNNILGSPLSLLDLSQGGAFVHNLFVGSVNRKTPGRYTPYHLPHQTDVAGLSTISSGDDRFFNNLLFAPDSPDEKLSYGLVAYNKTGYPCFVDGNVYYNRALPFEGEAHYVNLSDFNPDIKIEDKGNEVYISFTWKKLNDLQTEMVTTERLGKAKLAKQNYEQPDGKPVIFNTDYLNAPRSARPTPGPFESLSEGNCRIKVWPEEL